LGCVKKKWTSSTTDDDTSNMAMKNRRVADVAISADYSSSQVEPIKVT